MGDERIPPGDYRAKASRGYEWRESENEKATLGFQIPFGLTYFVGDSKRVTTLVLALYFPLDKPDAVRRSMEQLGFLGWDGKTPIENLNDSNGGLMTNEVTVAVGYENVQKKDATGKFVDQFEVIGEGPNAKRVPITRPRIKWINRGGGFGKLADKATVAKHADAIRRMMAKSAGGGRGAGENGSGPPATDEIPPGADGEEDLIPF